MALAVHSMRPSLSLCGTEIRTRELPEARVHFKHWQKTQLIINPIDKRPFSNLGDAADQQPRRAAHLCPAIASQSPDGRGRVLRKGVRPCGEERVCVCACCLACTHAHTGAVPLARLLHSNRRPSDVSSGLDSLQGVRILCRSRAGLSRVCTLGTKSSHRESRGARTAHDGHAKYSTMWDRGRGMLVLGLIVRGD